MKTTATAWAIGGLLALATTALAQAPDVRAYSLADGATPAFAPAAPTAAGSYRAVLGGPPQPAAAPAPPSPLPAAPDLARLQQLPLGTGEGSAAQALPAALAQLYPEGVRQTLVFQDDITALVTAVAVPGSRLLVALPLPRWAAGVPAGGAAPGQQLKLLTAGGERVVVVARPAAAGSHTLVVSADAKLAGQPVVVVGLAHAPQPAVDYEALALLYGRATQQLAQQLAAVQAQLADLRSQVAAAQRLNSALLLDHAEQADLKQQLNLLQSQQAATFSAARQRRGMGWPAD